MNIVKECKIGDWYVIEIGGKLDTLSSVEFEKKLKSLFAGGDKNIILDCVGLEYISSAGLRVLLIIAREADKAGGKFHLARVSNFVREVFAITGFDGLFRFHASVEEAIASGAGGAG